MIQPRQLSHRGRLLSLAMVLGLAAATMSVYAYDRRTPVVAAVEKVGPAVVNVRTEQVVRHTSPFGFGESLFDEFFNKFGPQRIYTTQSLGSGVLIDAAGHILTNAHVVEKASHIFVALPGERKELEAQVIGVDEAVDLAVLKVEAGRALPYLTLGRSDDLLPGETVIAIGNPLGLDHSVTTGVVSSPRRRIRLDDAGGFAVFIQSDALINPGNSGGPLLNLDGELVGINTAIASQAQGIGFAIPAEVAGRVSHELIVQRRLRPVWVGLLPGHIAEAMVASRGAGGVLVTEVEADSPAASAGLREADVLLAVDGVTLETPAEWLQLLASYVPGNRLALRLLRGTEELTLTLETAVVPAGYARRYAERRFGLRVEESLPGVSVSEIPSESSAARFGLRRGDRIAEVGGYRVTSLTDYEEALARNLGRFPLRLLVVRGSRGYYLDFD